MYLYHLKFELYVPAVDQEKSFIAEHKGKSQGFKHSYIHYVPKDIFASLPHTASETKQRRPQQKDNKNRSTTVGDPKSLQTLSFSDNSKKLFIKSEDHSPAVPPTPASEEGWVTVGKRARTTATSSASTSTSTSSIKSVTRNKTHDFRFGKLEIEWFDQVEDGSTMSSQKNTYASVLKSKNEDNHEADARVSTGRQTISSPATATIATTANTTSDSSIPVNSKSRSSTNHNVIPPTGEFIPLKSGVTNISYGILHLYRGKKEIKDNSQSSPQQNIQSQSVEENNSIHDTAGTILAVLAVPSYMSASDFLGFVAPVRNYVSHFRMIRDSAPNKYMVLMKFRHPRAARDFYDQFNGRPFSSMEPEICHIVYVQSIEFHSSSLPPYAFPFLYDPFESDQDGSKTKTPDESSAASSLYELPTCPVCLERMDAGVTGLLTILCQHTFHCHCLSKWGDSSCPVCRYSQKRDILENSLEQNECGVCGATENLWICLLCGNIGCGRYQEKHAYSHYEQTSHLYALELETQRVWDYAGDGYVHRLIQNKSDGKLVELPSPNAPPQVQAPPTEQAGQDKIDAIGLEYSYLLTTQLSSQRTYYEEKVNSITLQLSSLSAQVQSISDEMKVLKSERDKAINDKNVLEKERIPSLEKDKRALEKKYEKVKEKAEKIEKEYKEEKEMTASLLRKQQYFEAQMEEKDKMIKDLEEQVRDLMCHFSARNSMQDNPELAGGDIVVSETNSSSPGRRRKGRK